MLLTHLGYLFEFRLFTHLCLLLVFSIEPLSAFSDFLHSFSTFISLPDVFSLSTNIGAGFCLCFKVQVLSNKCFPADMVQLDESGRTTRILTTDFPHYFAVVTRVRQEVHAIGPEGGMVSSSVVPQVQAVFPQGALTKKIKVGLQVNLFKPRKNATAANLKKITVNHVPKKKRFSLVW